MVAARRHWRWRSPGGLLRPIIYSERLPRLTVNTNTHSVAAALVTKPIMPCPMDPDNKERIYVAIYPMATE